jgi:uncharacterized protein YndB with AHSA1/START domain
MTAPQFTTVDIKAPAEHVWAILLDVESWPEWTPSMSRVVREGRGEFGVGSRARVTQPRIGTATWQVTDLEPGNAYSWESRRPGLTTSAHHTVTPQPGGCTVRLEVRQRGLLALLVGALTANLTRRYILAEAQGLKQVSERHEA